jgi:Xaa-Pro dipeptidase
MCTDRRDFLRLSAFAAGATLLNGSLIEAGAEPLQQANQPEAIRRLRRMTDGVVPISMDERKARIEKARKLMTDNRIDAIYIEPGTSMLYFTDMRWGRANECWRW